MLGKLQALSTRPVSLSFPSHHRSESLGNVPSAALILQVKVADWRATLSHGSEVKTRLDLRLGVSAKGHSLEFNEWEDEDSLFFSWYSAVFLCRNQGK